MRSPEFAQSNLAAETGPLPLRSELVHGLHDALARIARIRTRRRLERDPVYRRIRPQLEQLLRGFEWDLEATLGHSLAPRVPGRVRAVAWNVERGKRFDSLRTLLTEEPELREADLLLLTELDVGMGRSGNRNVPKELAQALGMGYVFANYHIALTEGDRGERGHGVPNTKAMHGCALLTRFPVLRFEAVDLHERRDKFHATEKRMGNKRALLCELLLPDGPMTVATVHLDPFAGPRDREAQIRQIVARLREFGGERVLLGGDLNTNTYDLSSGRGLAYNFFYKLTRFGLEGTAAQYMKPEEHFERPVFEALRAGGLSTAGYNDVTRGTIYYDVYDPDLFRKAVEFMPRAVRHVMWTYLERALAPWGGRVPLRVDWFAGKGLRPRAAQVVERPLAAGALASDHNPIVVDLEIEAVAETDDGDGDDAPELA